MSPRAVFVVLGLLLASEALGAQREVLIWGGGKKPKDAAALRAKLAKAPSPLPGRMTLASGFPLTLESRTLKGLNPGFHIVVLGFCTREEAGDVLAELKSVNPGAYARTVTMPEGKYEGACPRLAEWPKAEAAQVQAALRKGGTVEPKQTVKVLGLTEVSEATGRFAALVELPGAEGATLVGLTYAGRGTEAKLLDITPMLAAPEEKLELQRELFHIAPREVAAGVTTSSQEEAEDPSGETFVTKERRELEVYHLTEEGPRSVLTFTAFEAKRNVECDVITQAEYGPVEDKLTEGFHPFRVELVTTDYCAQTYRGPPDEDESEGERGVTRAEEVHEWKGGGY